MLSWVFGVIAFLATVKSGLAACDSYANRCTTSVGKAIVGGGNEADKMATPIELDNKQYYYLTLPCVAETYVGYLDFNVLFGIIEVYVVADKEVSNTVYDYTNLDSIFPNQVNWVYESCHNINIMIKSVGKSIFIGRAGSSAGVLPSAVVSGYPQALLMSPNSPQSFVSTAVCGNYSDVIVTMLSGGVPSLTVTPANHAPVTSRDGQVSFQNPPSAKGSVVKINAVDKNATIASLLFREQSGNDKCPVHLPNGAAQRDKIAHVGGQQFYIFQVPAGISGSVTISLEATQGDADLFVNVASDGFYHREQAINGAIPKWSSQRPNGIDLVSIPSTDQNYIKNGGAYYITAYGYTDAEYILRVTAGNVVSSLQDGFPVTDQLKGGQYRYYRYYDTHLNEATWLDLRPTGGDADIFVSCKINPTGDDVGFPSKADGHFNFSSTSYLEDTLIIEPRHKRSCARNHDDDQVTLYIAVYGYAVSTYTLSAMHATGTVRLMPGVPYTGMVFKQIARHFTVRVGFEAQDLTIQLMPFYGDCDLFVKMKGTADLGNFDYYSIRAGSTMDIVTIPEDKICTNCEIGVTVYGFETARFSVLAYFTDSTLTLSNGIPMRGSVAEDKIQYYTYSVDTDGSSSAMTTLTLFNGLTPTIYMSTTVERPNATTPNTIKRLSTSNEGTVPKLELPGLHHGSMVYIGIEGTETNSSYSVRVHSILTGADALPPILPLLEGVPQADSIPRNAPSSWLYYAVQAPAGHESITIRSLNIIGNVDLYVTKCNLTTLAHCAEHNLPDLEHFITNTADLDEDVLKIHRRDSSTTLYIVGVYSNSFYSAFQLSFGYESSILELQAGVAVTDHVFDKEYDYFAFYMDQPRKVLKITLSPMSGDPDIFVSTTTKYPSASNSTWRGIRYGSDVIEINTDSDTHACVYCTYYITVYGAAEATYSIMASVETTYFTLQDGVPMTGTLGRGSWNYYVFVDNYGSARDFRAVLSSINGNADMFITLDGSIPSWNNFDYRSTRSLTDDEITIKHTDSTYSPCISETGVSSCRIIIGVQGVDASSEYTLSFTSSIASNLLPLGRTVSGVVGFNDYVYYRVSMNQRGNNNLYTLRITGTPTSGHMAIYASCERPMPKRNTSTWSLVPATTGVPLEITSFQIMEAGCLRSTANMYFSVYGYYSPASFSIQAQIVNNASVNVLGIGQTINGLVESSRFSYYYIRPSNLFSDIQLTLSVVFGDVDLYVSNAWDKRPQLINGVIKSFDYKSANVGNDDVLISHRYVQSSCKTISGCYFIVGVYAAYGSSLNPIESSFLLTARLQDSTVTLANGIAHRGSVGSGNTDYYKFSLLQRDVDVTFSVSAMYGDPDMFIGVGKNQHPRMGNATWAQMSLGADTLTLQYDEIKKRCIPDPANGKPCDFFVGVYGWRNCSYAITVTVNDGFASPVVLFDQQPATGMVGQGGYQYFKYFIRSSPPGPHSSVPLSLQFILTPAGGADIDLYMTIAANDSVAREPGRQTFDYKSTSWSDVVEHIEFSYGMPQYCYDCVVYLAAYGYSAGPFSIQVSSTGIFSLQDNVAVGGVINKNAFNYYSFYNADAYAEMTIMLTSISGDADLYITRRRKTDAKLNLPTKTSYIWRSMFYGSDTVNIAYDDKDFCSECEYLIGVTGYTNATFTLTVTSKTASIIRLRPNRPQNAALTTGDWMYFSSDIPTTTADVTISATSLSTGYVDLYVRLINASSLASGHPVLPNPADPKTYSYSTRFSEDSHVFIPGPRNEDNAIALITVVALSNVRFVVMAATSNHPVLLQLGIPQSHFVSQGGNAVFQLYPNAYDDLRVTVTARTGDPDLFVSSGNVMPTCTAGENSWEVTCTNYTWSSRMYSTDQIIISRDFPCTRVLPATYIAPTCDPDTAFVAGRHNPVFVTVYGYMASKFSIMGAAVGQSTQLLPGQPQLSTTSVGFICSDRSHSTGTCDAHTRYSRKVQIAYFTFQVAASRDPSSASSTSHLDMVNDVILTVMPTCNHTGNVSDAVYVSQHRRLDIGTDTVLCEPGCACAPLRVNVNSCPMSRCTEADRKPSELPGQFKLSLTVDPATGATIFITADDLATKNAYCDPNKNDEDCLYFVSISHEKADDPAAFTITARTPSDISLIPCDAREYPDRIRVQTSDYIPPSSSNVNSGGLGPRHQQRFYELCSQSNPKLESYRRLLAEAAAGSTGAVATLGTSEQLIVEAEQCHGHTSLYACADDGKCAEVLPSLQSWGYFADHTRSCVHSFEKYGRETCQWAPQGSNLITLRLPQIDGNYFLMANGTGRYTLQVRSTSRGVDLAPYLMFSGIQEFTAGEIDVVTVSGNTMTLRWRQAYVLLPGIPEPLVAEYMTYKVYIFDENKADTRVRKENIVQQSTCGLEYLSTVLPTSAVTIIPNAPVAVADRGKVFMSYTVRGLKTMTAYRIAVVAVCDSYCLSQVTKANASPRLKLSCNGGSNECKAQSLAYLAKTMTTSVTPDEDHESDTHSGGSSGMSVGGKVALAFGIIFLVLLLVGILLAGAYWWKSHRILSGVDVDDNSPASSPFGAFLDTLANGFTRVTEMSMDLWHSLRGQVQGLRNGRTSLPTSSHHNGMDESWGGGSRESLQQDRTYVAPSAAAAPSATTSGLFSGVQTFGSTVKQSWSKATSSLGGLRNATAGSKPSASRRDDPAGMEGQAYLPLQVLGNGRPAATAATRNPMQASSAVSGGQQFTLEEDDDEEVHVSL